jgi:hypothetical protein
LDHQLLEKYGFTVDFHADRQGNLMLFKGNFFGQTEPEPEVQCPCLPPGWEVDRNNNATLFYDFAPHFDSPSQVPAALYDAKSADLCLLFNYNFIAK